MTYLQEKFSRVIEDLKSSAIDREAEVRLLFIGLLADKSVLFGGPPGCAKSMIIENMQRCIEGSVCFTEQLHKFTTPDEICGPMDVAAFKSGVQRRLVDGYMPGAHLVFLDEVTRAGQSVLSSLLRLMNEKKYRDGSRTIDCPMLLLCGATNSWPIGEKFADLDAFYDRFVIRRPVSYVSKAAQRRELIRLDAKAPWAPSERLTLDEVHAARLEVKGVSLPKEIEDALLGIEKAVLEANIQHSDRRLGHAVRIAKAAAWMGGSAQVRMRDLKILAYVLIHDPAKDIPIVEEILRTRCATSDDSILALGCRAAEIYSKAEAGAGDKAKTATARMAELGQHIADVKSILTEIKSARDVEDLSMHHRVSEEVRNVLVSLSRITNQVVNESTGITTAEREP